MTAPRLEFSPRTKVLACLRYYPEIVQDLIDDALDGKKLTNDRAKEMLPSILAKIKCVGLFEINLICNASLATGAEFDHIKRNKVEPDNSVENCRPLCGRACHKIKSARDKKEDARNRSIRRETKKSQLKEERRGKHFRTGGKIQSAGFLSKEERDKAKQWKQEQVK